MTNREYCEKSCSRERVQGDGGRIATASVRTGFAMTGGYMGCGTRPGGSSGRPTPTHRLPIYYRRGRCPHRPASVTRVAVGRANRGVRPYGGVHVVRRGVCVEENSEKRKSKKPIAFAIGFLVGDGGFEPPKASPADLQSVPFGHSGNPPYYL